MHGLVSTYLTRFWVQCLAYSLLAVQPGVASVHASVLQKSPNGVAFYIRDFPQMASMKYGDVRRRFNTSILCGWFSGEDRLPHLNPKDDYVFKNSDKLIFLANTGTWRLDT